MIKPMLAQKVNTKPIDWTNKVFVQPKLDGIRCIFTKDGAYSRAGNEFKNVSKIMNLLKDEKVRFIISSFRLNDDVLQYVESVSDLHIYKLN